MSANFDADLDAMLGEPFGSPLAAAGQSDWGVMTYEGTMIFGNEVVHVGPSILARRSLYDGLDYGDLLTFEGSVYKVLHKPLTGGDGKLCRIPLQFQGPAILLQVFALTTADSGRQFVTTDTGQPIHTQPT
jgi:hypothetical protein